LDVSHNSSCFYGNFCSEAPALSTDFDVITAEKALGASTSSMEGGATEVTAASTNNDWDEDALVATFAKKNAAAAAAGATATAELLDMKALEIKHREQDDIAERLRVEETKAQLAAAREGMEKEAQRIKEEAEKKEEKKIETAAVSGGRWIPPHLRAGGAATTTASRFGSVSEVSRKLDVADENLFPDLAAADKLLEKQHQQQQQVAYKVHKKTPVGGGASWASRPPASIREPPPAPKEPEPTAAAPKSTPEPVDEPKKEETKQEAPLPAAAAATATAPKKKLVTKKKKKDLSTFKLSSAS
jgi:hypothetical protein